jgi:DNA-binding transcriptional regulator YiaG
MNKEQVLELRKSLSLTQVKFAALLHISLRTVKSWEAGENKPSGLYLNALLELRQRIPLLRPFDEKEKCDSTDSQVGTPTP